MSKENSFIRLICESCGAPLSKTSRKGKFNCEHCGSLYYDPVYNDTSEEVIKTAVEIN